MSGVSPDQKGSQPKTTNDSDELNALTTALKGAFVKQEPDPRTRFHEQFRKEADEYDRDFHKKYHDDLNTTLIFAGLFSAVASAFIVEIQSQLRPDYEQFSFAVLTMLLNTTSGIPNQTAVPTWSGPDPSAVQAQSILFASLSSALLAAFFAMLGKQWLNLHVEGSFIDRNRHRELRMRGMITWKFKFVMECLPLIMQGSLLLLGYALAQYFWSVSRTVSSVITGFTAFGLIFFLFIVFAATFSKACPFQTPLSVVLRLVIQRCRDHAVNVYKTARGSYRLNRSHRGVTRQNQTPLPPFVSNIDEQDSEVRADSNCITTMFRMTKASESVIAIMAYIPEITWDKRIKLIPLMQVYQALRESLWRSADGKALLRPGAGERALGSAKALLHLYIQRRCIYGVDEILTNQVQSIDHPRQPLGHGDLDGDSDLKSTFYIVDWAFGVEPQIPWSEFKLSKPHHCWLGHTLKYRAWDSLQTHGRLSGDVRGFLDYSLACGTLPDRVVADCLFIINMMAGHRPQPQELVLKDRSHQIVPLIDDVFDMLEATFKQNTPSGDITPAVEALSLLVLLQQKHIRIKSYALFRTIMGLVKGDERLWTSARLSMKGAYSSTEWVPPTGDPKDILDFLHFHISSPQTATVGDEPIYHAFRSIVINPNPEKRRGLTTYDFGSPVFIDAMIQLLLNGGYMVLQRMSLLLLPELDNLLFTSEAAFNDPGRASAFVMAWSTAIGRFLQEGTTPQVEVAGVKILLAIANLPRLRVYLPPERWGLAYKFPTILYSNSPSMQRCTQNPDIIPFIKQSAGVTGTLGWLGMLWMKYHSLSDEVRRQLEEETRAIGSSSSHYDLDSYLRLFNFELKRLQEIIEGLEPLDRTVPGLRAELDAMERAKGRLVEIQEMQKLRQSQPKERQTSPKSHTWLGIGR